MGVKLLSILWSSHFPSIVLPNIEVGNNPVSALMSSLCLPSVLLLPSYCAIFFLQRNSFCKKVHIHHIDVTDDPQQSKHIIYSTATWTRTNTTSSKCSDFSVTLTPVSQLDKAEVSRCFSYALFLWALCADTTNTGILETLIKISNVL